MENEHIAGVCGEIQLSKPRWYSVVESAQQFEYKMSHILDKAMESMFGYISVLPGAFSAYRWKAVIGSPLEAYLKKEGTPPFTLGAFHSNMYLAEDRILCFELLSRDDVSYTLKYVPNAVAKTDGIKTLIEMFGQRRRWLNGSLFAQLYYHIHGTRMIANPAHSFGRKVALTVQYGVNVVTLIANWFGLGLLYLSLYSIFSLCLQRLDISDMAMFAFDAVYSGCLLLQLLCGLSAKKPAHVKDAYEVTCLAFGLMMLLSMFGCSLLLSKNAVSLSVLIAAISAPCAFIITSVLHGQVFAVAQYFVQYLLFLPVYITVLPMYAFCNLHDCSWGNRPTEGSQGHELQEMKEQEYIAFKLRALFLWLTSNWIVRVLCVNACLTVLYSWCRVCEYSINWRSY